jgi:flavin-dependent dehydrogenase
MTQKLYDAAVVGGGPAGAAVAIELALAGRSVVVFEKERGPHDKVCGEFMSHEGAGYLTRLGVSLSALGAVPISSVTLSRQGEAVEAALPFQAHSLSRRLLDEAILRRAADAGAEVRRGARVKSVAAHSGAWSVSLDSGETVVAGHAFIATGKHDLKDWKRPPGAQPNLIAFKTYWRLAPDQTRALDGTVELILFPGGYAGLQLVEDGRANLCLLVQKRAFASRYRSWEGLLAQMLESSAHLKMRLAGAACLLDRPLAITRLPYGHVAASSAGPWLVGDQAAVIPSFSGDGMSIALHSAHRASQCFLGQCDAAGFQEMFAEDVSAQVGRATALSQLLVSDAGQRMARAVAGIFPQVMPLGARLTRISSRLLPSNGLA